MRDCTAVMAINLSRSQHGCAGCPGSSERDLDAPPCAPSRIDATVAFCGIVVSHHRTAKCTALGHPYSITNPREHATTSGEVRFGSLRPALRYRGILATFVRFQQVFVHEQPEESPRESRSAAHSDIARYVRTRDSPRRRVGLLLW
jgi:hypothetical protein